MHGTENTQRSTILIQNFSVYISIQDVAKPMSQTSPGYSPSLIKKTKLPLNMDPKVNRFRDIHCCVEIGEML